MTIGTTTSIMDPQVSDGVVTDFTFNFKIFAEADLVVVHRDPNGTETIQTLSTDYTVSGSPWASGGTVVFTAAPATGEIIIYRSITLTSNMDLIQGGKLPPETLETKVDQVIAAMQDVQAQFDRAMRFARTVTSFDTEMDWDADQRASRVLGFNAVGGLELSPAVDSGIPIGKQSIWIPAAAWGPRVSNGCSALTAVELAAGTPNLIVRDFDAAADEFAQLFLALPKSWNKGTLTYRVFWTGLANTGDVLWDLQGAFMADDQTINSAYGTAVELTDTHSNVANDMMITGESAGVTLSGTPADHGIASLQLSRNADDAGDTYTHDARLIGVLLHFTTDVSTDA